MKSDKQSRPDANGIAVAVMIAATMFIFAGATLIGRAAPPSTKRTSPDDVSDFFPPATQPQATTAPAATMPSQIFATQDAAIGQAIDHGVDFLLAQFRDNQLANAEELSDSQRQALDALCVYALAQASHAISDPRLNIRSGMLPGALDRLRSYELVSDAQKMNRPITYGRSLRAAALATFDRPGDRPFLKQDVAWLIKSQIDGGYTYDDLYNELIRQGLRPNTSRIEPQHGYQTIPPVSDDASAQVTLAQDFGGGSPDPGFNPGTGPYPPVSPTPPTSPSPFMPPGLVSPPAPRSGGGPPIYPHYPYEIRLPPVRYAPPFKPVVFPRPYPSWWKFPTPPPVVAQRNYVGPNVPSRQGPPGRGPAAVNPSVRPYGDDQAPLPKFQFEFPWDNSNSQYGLLGVWAGAEVGIEVPDRYWLAVEKHWMSCQLKNGQWGYNKREPTGTFAMTCGGVASLLVTHEYLDLPMLRGSIGRDPYSPLLAWAIDWLDQGDNGVATPNNSTHYFGYDLFGLERVGLASGYKFFGKHDWYRELSDRVVAMQNANGSWGHEDHGIDTIVDTAYSILFLSRGRHPILMTKLKFDKFWDNRPRDVANLAKFASRQLERQINWQVVGIEHSWNDWFDSPVVYLASHQAPKLKEHDYAELRNFVLAGGLVFTHSDMSSGNFDKWVPELAKKIAPNLPLRPIPNNDAIYSLQYKLPTHRPLLGISNGVRWLLVHSPNDIAMAWQQRSDKTRLQDFQLGLNIFLYAAGKPDLRNRLESPFLPAPPAAPTKVVKIARLKFDGNWNPETAAWPRFSRYLQWETGQSLDLGWSPIEKLTLATAPIATLTGTGTIAFSDAQCAAMKSYVNDGGILLIDPCGGDNEFKLAVRDVLLPKAFAGAKSIPLSRELAMPMKLRPYSLERLGGALPQIQLLSIEKGYVVVSPLDLTHALLGTNTWGIDGYQPASAQTFLAKLILWSEHR